MLPKIATKTTCFYPSCPIYAELGTIHSAFASTFASLSVARGREPPSAVRYGNSQQRISRLRLILGTNSPWNIKSLFSCIQPMSVMNRPGPTRSGSIRSDHDAL